MQNRKTKMTDYKIAVSCGKGMGIIENKVKSWADIVKKLTHHVEVAEKEKAGFFVGGAFCDDVRVDEYLLCRSLLTLDIDKYKSTIDDLEFDLDLMGLGAFVAYSTHSHTSDKPRVRLVLPLSRDVSRDEYRQLSRSFCESYDPSIYDECSYKPNQFMFYPSCAVGGERWALSGEGAAVDVDKFLAMGGGGSSVFDNVTIEDDDDEDFTRDLPLNMSDDEVKGLLFAYQAQGLEYDAWLKVGQALHHQYQGEDKGFDLWVSWSALSDKHDIKPMRKKYNSFGTWSGARVTMASVVWHVKQQGGVVASVFDTLRVEAQSVTGYSDYLALKKRICAMNESVLHDDMRSTLAADIIAACGKDLGLTKSEVKKAFCFDGGGFEKSGDVVAASPDWLNDWVYVEKLCEFANTRLNYSIKREAFNAKYNRMEDVKSAEMLASDYALTCCELLTCVDKMYWPSFGVTFEYDNKLMLNSYVDSGYKSVVVNDDNKHAIDLFLTHINNVLVDEREQRILIDWLAYVVQNAGKRINWAILLQGAQGTGKSYFAKVLEWVLGSNAKSLDPSALGERFTGWAHGAVVNIVEEIRIKGDDKWRIMDRLKPFITNSMIQIEEKGRDHRTVPNFTNYLLLTNYKDALPITNDDRRFCVMYGRIQNETELFNYFGGRDATGDYFEHLFAESEKHAGAIKTFLLKYKISDDFKASGRAPDTKSRQAMIQATISPEQCSVEDLINKHDCAVVNGRILDVTWLAKLCEPDGDMLPPTRTLGHILSDMGYSQIDGRRVYIKKTNTQHYVWFKHSPKNDSQTVKKEVILFFKGDFDEIPF
jgi:hypothetical protein